MGLLDLLGMSSTSGGDGGGGLLGSGTGGINQLYGNVLTPDQQQGLRQRGMLGFLQGMANSGALDYTVPFISGKVPGGFAKALAAGAGGMGEAEDKGLLNALNAQLVGLQGQNLASQLAIRQKLMSVLPGLMGNQGAANPAATAGIPDLTPRPNNAAAPEIDTGNLSDPRGKIPVIQASAMKYGIDPNVAVAVADQEGLHTFLGDGGKSGGAFQLYTGGGVGNEFQKETGLDPLDPKNEDATIDFAMRKAAEGGWGPWNGAKKIGITGFMGIGTGPIGAANQPQPTPFSQPPGDYSLPSRTAQMPPGLLAGAGPPDALLAPGLSPQHLAVSSAYANAVQNGFKGTIQDFVAQQGSGAAPAPSPVPQLTGQGAPITQAQLSGPRPPATLLPPAAGPAGAPQPQMPPQGLLSPPGAVPAAQPPAMVPGGALQPPGTLSNGINPQNLASAGVLAQLGGIGDAFKPLEQYYYNSPGYIQQKAAAEAEAQNRSKLQYAGPLAAAEYPYKVGEAQAGPAERGSQARQTAAFEANLNANPYAMNFAPPQGTAAAKPIPVPATSDHPFATTLPPVTEQPPISGGAKALEKQQSEWGEITNKWGQATADNAIAIQRVQAMMDAMKLVQTGAYTSELAHFNAALKTAGIAVPPEALPDPAKVQEILKNNFQAAIATMKGTGNSRWTQRELAGAQESMSNPNLQPEANLKIGAQLIGTLSWENAKNQDWALAKQNMWVDPAQYEAAWVRHNPLQPFVDKAEQAIGPLKGMPGFQQPGPRRGVFNPKTGTIQWQQ